MSDVGVERETAEHLPVPVYVDGTLTTDFETSVTKWPVRPTIWVDAVVDPDGDAGVVVAGLTPGTYQVWVRVNGAIVVAAGTVTVR